ncbi:unnamed protein product [Adineta ricciae]|uniref:Apple domain-containing protein n=1 Tax=Adineta ricciae TaxID=249248 RepID=A0A813MI08_ADIRI|nr:unnamed protein product [Adineta ricciae]CAF1123315.1 unnamed protein product [Adineta ricciae]
MKTFICIFNLIGLLFLVNGLHIPRIKRSDDFDWNAKGWAVGCDFKGRNLKDIRVGKQHCVIVCGKTPQCTHFTWTPYRHGTCWMKTGRVKKSDAVASDDPEAICGSPRFVQDSEYEQPALYTRYPKKSKINWNGNNWAIGCDFNGREFKSVEIPGEDCGGACATTPRCTHFTWSSYRGGTCSMKSGYVTQDDAIVSKDPKMICGSPTFPTNGESTSKVISSE